METGRLDSKAVEKLDGPAWETLRDSFFEMSDSLLGVSDSANGELTTIYVKYAAEETGNRPYGVIWIKKSTVLTLGLSLPEDVAHPRLGEAPKGCTYSGLTRYLIVDNENPVPNELSEWVRKAFENLTKT